MTKPKTTHFDTLSLHAGARPDPATGARATPIYQTASYVFADSDHAAALFNMERAGHVYSRISNPTCAVLEERIAALEGGVGAIAVASGQAALHLAIVTLMGAGAHIVASRALYGGSHNLLDYTLPRFGITTTFVDPRDLDAWRAAIRPETRLLMGETLGNPGLDVLDVPRVASLAHEHGLPLLVDSTFTTPYLMQPFAHGADLVYHSATKFLSGHGVVIGGLVVDSGQFDWDGNGRYPAARGKFPTLTEPYAGFHDMVFTEESTTGAFLLRARREGIRDFGACMAPFVAFQILQGIETLPLRMARHVENTRRDRRVPARAAAGRRDRLPGAARSSRSRARAAVAARRLRRRLQLQPQRYPRAGAQIHRDAEDLFAPRQCRRCQVAGDPSGVDHAFPHVGGGSRQGRDHRGHDSAVGRARASGRPDRGPVEGAPCGRKDVNSRRAAVVGVRSPE